MTLPSDIFLHGPFSAPSRTGTPYEVLHLTLAAEGYVPDVRVRLASPQPGARLYDDPVFIYQVMTKLREAGYTGAGFDRAELGLQEDDCIVLEPCADFRPFAAGLGWVDLGEAPRVAPRASPPCERSEPRLSKEELYFVFRMAPMSDELFDDEDPAGHYRAWYQRLWDVVEQQHRTLPDWWFVDADGIECENFTLFDSELEYAEEESAHRFRYLEFSVNIGRERQDLLAEDRVREMGRAIEQLLAPVTQGLDWTLELAHVKYYRKYEHTESGFLLS